MCSSDLVNRDDNIGKVLMGLQSMQIRLGFETQEAKMKAAESARILAALDTADTNIMLANADHDIIYANAALKRMFAEAEADIRSALPQFRAAEPCVELRRELGGAGLFKAGSWVGGGVTG